MTRLLLALSLAFATTAAFASEPAQAEPDGGLCPKQEAQDAKPANGKSTEPSAGPGATAPVRPRRSGVLGPTDQAKMRKLSAEFGHHRRMIGGLVPSARSARDDAALAA